MAPGPGSIEGGRTRASRRWTPVLTALLGLAASSAQADPEAVADRASRLEVPAHQFQLDHLDRWRARPAAEARDDEPDGASAARTDGRPAAAREDDDEARGEDPDADLGDDARASESEAAPDRREPRRARLLAGYRDPRSGAHLAITRVDYPNRRAWRRDERFFDEVEAGVAAAASDYRAFLARRHRLGRVPALDLGFHRRRAGARQAVLMRFLFFRRYTLTLTVTAPARAYRREKRALRALMSSFEPFFGD